jgi:hypothetical protein
MRRVPVMPQACDRGGAGRVRGAGAHVLPQRGGAGGVPPAVGGEGAAGHRLHLRRLGARGPREPHGHRRGHLRWQARHPRKHHQPRILKNYDQLNH